MDVADDGLAVGHRLDRKQPVPAGIELVDDDVRPREPGTDLVVAHVLDHVEVDPELLARGDDHLGALSPAGERGVGDPHGAVCTRRHRLDRREVDSGRHHLGVRDPAGRVVRADDLHVRQTPVGKLVGRLAADVRADEVEDGLLASRSQDRKLHPLRHQGQPEVEMEDVGSRQQLRERPKLRGLPAPRGPLRYPEVHVGLRMGHVRVEDDEPRIDAHTPQRPHVHPADPREVHGAMNNRGGPRGSPTSPLLLHGFHAGGCELRRAKPGFAGTSRFSINPIRPDRNTVGPFAPRECGPRTTRARRLRFLPARASARGKAGSDPPGRRPSRSAD